VHTLNQKTETEKLCPWNPDFVCLATKQTDHACLGCILSKLLPPLLDVVGNIGDVPMRIKRFWTIYKQLEEIQIHTNRLIHFTSHKFPDMIQIKALKKVLKGFPSYRV